MTATTTAARSGEEPGPADASAQEAGRYLTFTLKGEVYALDILEVTEIIEFRSLTVVPMMPPFVRGVINLRGRVLPVIDLAARFGQGATDVTRRTSIVVVDVAGHGHGHREMGVVVDAVTKVVPLPARDLEPAPAFGGGVRADFIAGMARWDDAFVIVLDLARVLSVEELRDLGDLADHAASARTGVPT
ncbi:MAG: chemotaxis protein CheW [Kineosporiaceae bacterium]